MRGLAARLGAQRVFCALAAALEQEADLSFAATLVQALNLLLLTVPEVRRHLSPRSLGPTTISASNVDTAWQRHGVSGQQIAFWTVRLLQAPLRGTSCCLLLLVRQAAELRGLLQRALQSAEGGRLFAALYRSWAHSAGATLSLCLLARAYEHAAAVVAAFADIPVTLEVLMQVAPPPAARIVYAAVLWT